MAEEKIKTVRILFTDKTKDIPVTLWDSYLKQNVELNPDAMVSEEFAKELVTSFSCYEIIPTGKKVDKKDYKIREDYKVVELKNIFEFKLTPEEREEVVDYAQALLDEREKKETAENTTQIASEVEVGKTDTGTENKGDSK